MKEKLYTKDQVVNAMKAELTQVNATLNINGGKLTDSDYEALGKLYAAFERLEKHLTT